MSTYKPLKTGEAVAFGTSGQAVSDYQTQLNNTNKGVAGYTPLTVDGKYGPLTQAASQFKAPTTTTTPPPVLTEEKFARGTNPNDKAIKDLTDKLNNSVLPAPNENDIFNKNKTQAQGVIDAITSQFNRVIEEQNVTNAGFNDRVRANNISAGLGGSDFGTANAIGQETKNKKAISLIEGERDAKINEILLNLSSRSSDQYKQEREAYVKSLGDNLDRLRALKEEDRQKATDTIQSLARQKVSLDKYKAADPKGYETLLNEYGGSQMDLDAKWNDSLPDDQKVKYQDKIMQGANGNATLFRYGLNPQTGQVEEKEYPLNVDYNSLQGIKPTVVDGRLFALETDANGDQVARPLTSKTSSSSSGKGYTSGGVTFNAGAMNTFTNKLESTRGADGWVDPQAYQDAFNAWTDAKGLAKDFLAKYPPNKYADPANTTLPAVLRNTTGKKTASSTNRTP